MPSSDALTLHRDSLVVDGLNASNFLVPAVFERIRAGGVHAVHATVAAWHGLPETMRLLAKVHAMLGDPRSGLLLVREPDDARRAKRLGELGVVLGFQGAGPIEDDPGLLAIYRALGVRIVQLTYSTSNRLGNGYADPVDDGLTAFGRDVVREMNRLGMTIDLSHCGDRTAREAIELSEKPVAFTHVASRALHDVSRNKPPELLKEVARRGGVIGALAFSPLLTASRSVTVDDYVRSIEHLVEIAGIEHVALGPDFMDEMRIDTAAEALTGLSDETQKMFRTQTKLEGFSSIAELPNVTERLLARGFSTEDVRKILGENWLRLYDQTWKPMQERPRS